MMTKPQLIRLIHIAKSKLSLDDETYRAKLQAAVGKTSCTAMTHGELQTVYQSFQDAGFKRQFSKKKGAHVSPNSQGKNKAPEIAKIRAIWLTMHEQWFVTRPDESSLNAYVMRQTKRLNGVGVAEVGWLNSYLAYKVLEALKAWHLRLIKGILKTRRIVLPTNRNGDEVRSYDAITGVYERIRQLDEYLNNCRARGDFMLASSFPCCGFRFETPAPTDRAETWDSLVGCPVCRKQFMRIVTCHSVIMRAVR
ncbi:regulatory protein GemA [Limnobaculum zhutongyuii]|uniref:Regulatory protein GemA n=2 Tax=Limnobaculum zhutongyuii TaxID=2498113 RepID=A0A411WKQ1_9GAMM|nr:regulatory protein GemA [Limnobaculum zhutongyuii]QBH96804.1 regulatory protein GemA [Limnobaculum zhutongyuii]TQS90165.1 regulatory protein GemA [Limnobaculum zhutongyuii]